MDVRKFEADCYVQNGELFDRYRSFETERGDVVDFNHASLTRPYPEVFELLQKATPLQARLYAGSLVGINDPTKVIFGRNTTEAFSFTYWLAHVEGGNVVVSDAENESIARIYSEHRDHGNTNRKDGWSTFPDEIVQERYRGSKYRFATGVPIKTANFLGDYRLECLVDEVDENTHLVVVSHVIRNDGRIIDIETLAKKVKDKNPETYIAIDGAQAVGNLPCVDFNRLENSGIDFYSATPHKSLGSYPLGILYISDRAKNNIKTLEGLASSQQIIMDGMIPEKYTISSNVDSELHPLRYLSLVTSLDTLINRGYVKGNNFSRKTKRINNLKDAFISNLRECNGEIFSEGEQYSPAILSFRFPGKDNRELVSCLQKAGMFCSYISETDNIRVSFEITNTKWDIKNFFMLFKLIKVI
ncbi:MAG: hypothetical protein RL557_408 [archaeon]|jgi:selenocysteine lyase/cysteine desulfurase